MKPTEIYAFVGWVSTFGGFLFFFTWGILPDSVLQSIGIQFYPDKSWALAIPSVFLMTVTYAILVY